MSVFLDTTLNECSRKGKLAAGEDVCAALRSDLFEIMQLENIL
jgi:hypothetical protein